MEKVCFYNIGEISFDKIEYVTIVGKKNNKYLAVFNNKRNSWELPGGKREIGENIETTARRELFEETQVYKFRLNPIYIYSFAKKENITYGLLYFCEIFGDIEKGFSDEIGCNQWLSDLDMLKILENKHKTIFNEAINNRKIINSWYVNDTRKTIGRISYIYSKNKVKALKQAVADPINIVETLKNYFKTPRKKGPIQLDVNPLSICSDKCIFCFNKNDRVNLNEKLNYDKIKTCIDWLVENTSVMHIKSSGFGEPTLYEELWKLFKYTRAKGLYNTLNTNGFNLENNIQNIIETLDSIRFSIDAYNEKSFYEIHGCKDFNKRIKNIKRLVEIRDKQQPNLIIGIHYVVLPNNYTGLHKFIKLIKNMGIDYIDITLGKFNVNYLLKWDDNFKKAIKIIKESRKFINDDFNVILPLEETLEEKKLITFRNNRFDNNKCWQIDLRHFITPLGEYGACNAFESQPIKKRIFGNIYNNSMDEIFTNINIGNHDCLKNKDCKYCVIPHGTFNDLCQSIYTDIRFEPVNINMWGK